ncbi:S-adenosyl-L-methionine-dependent methyltransferase [Cladochytrium replicatum]|nr:S-adenosyl-L-methionine-dependent methyltransferase [Cladochytrium replicatum]
MPIELDKEAAAHWEVPTGVMGSNSSVNSSEGSDRTYHSSKASPYVIPADAQEGQRLNLQHHLLRQLFDGPNHGSGIPVEALERGLKVLDVGCGSGIWLAEMNRDFPNGIYYGVDMETSDFAQIFQEISGKGRINLVEGNVLERLPFDDNTFDYIHQQMLVYAVPEARWPHVIAELARVLKPGGYIDLVEINTVQIAQNQNETMQKNNDIFIQAFLSRGINLTMPKDLGRYLQQNGSFVNIDFIRRTAPIGWDGEVGYLWQVDAEKALLGMAPFFAAAFGMTTEKWVEYVNVSMEEAVKNKAFFNAYRAVARKQPT